LLVVAAITADAKQITIAKTEADASTKIEEIHQVKCSKCQGDLEQGYILEIQDSRFRAPADWVQGTMKGGLLPGFKVKTRRQILAYRCTTCCYIELFVR
jgi:hypothetical protein